MNDYSKLSEKAELIYKFDKKTPLFAIAASKRIADDNLEEAEKVLSEGLVNFPDYPTAHLILSKVLLKLGKEEEARAALNKGLELNPNIKTKEYYEALFAGKEEAEEEIDPIMKEINEEILPEKPEDEEVTEEEEFVSETLAAVYKAQGAFEEALKMYEKLIEKTPEKEDIYRSEIEELKKKIN